MSSEDGGTTLSPRGRTEEKVQPPALQGFEVELKRRPGEGFGFVIASQGAENGRGECFNHTEVLHMYLHAISKTTLI